MRAPYAVAAALLVLTACSSEPEEPGPPERPSQTEQPEQPTPSASPAVGRQPDWRPVAGSVDAQVTRNREWTLTVNADGRSWELAGPSSNSGSETSDRRVSDALLDEDWAVVVLQDQAEQRPSTATVTDLESGESFTLDGGSDVPTTTGGTWALGDDRLVHATVQDGRYCLAQVDLETRQSSVAWCAPKRHGFSTAHVSDDTVAMLTFDDSRPSCRTVVTLDGETTTPFAGAEECKGWEGISGEDGEVWSVIPRERRIEEARFHAAAGGEETDLGPGVAGSLVACGDAAYFVRDPERQGDPAALMRWSADDGLSVAYESAAGQAFLEPPRCGGDAITITARTSSGDEQVTADL